MLKTIQIVALIQGVFLVLVLFKSRHDYKRINFWLLLGCILSVMAYSIGDDDYNLFVNNADWFLFHDTLIITFFFLFIRYYKSGKEKFNNRDLWFITPYVIHVLFNIVKAYTDLNSSIVFKIGKGLTEFAFVIMLLYTVYDIIKTKKEKWLLFFMLPLTFIFIVDELAFLITGTYDSPFFLDSFGIILTAVFLFYFVLYKLIIAPKEVLPQADSSKYKTSNLDATNINANKEELLRLMTEEKLFKNSKLTVNDVAKKLDIPRQHLSEILNVHMKRGFQELLNYYRVEEFIECLQSDAYKNYTLLGIANEVGFSSKSSFNTTFKKLKGMTPSQYKKSIL